MLHFHLPQLATSSCMCPSHPHTCAAHILVTRHAAQPTTPIPSQTRQYPSHKSTPCGNLDSAASRRMPLHMQVRRADPVAEGGEPDVWATPGSVVGPCLHFLDPVARATATYGRATVSTLLPSGCSHPALPAGACLACHMRHVLWYIRVLALLVVGACWQCVLYVAM